VTEAEIKKWAVVGGAAVVLMASSLYAAAAFFGGRYMAALPGVGLGALLFHFSKASKSGANRHG